MRFFVDHPVLDNDPVLEDKPNQITWKCNHNERCFPSPNQSGSIYIYIHIHIHIHIYIYTYIYTYIYIYNVVQMP